MTRPEQSGFGTSKAARTLVLVVALVSARGLALAVDWQSGPGYRSAPLPVPVTGKAGFTLLAPSATGILFTNTLPESRHLTNQILLNGSGVAAGDVDGDGWCDLYFCSIDGRNKLYRNRGNWRFEDITEQAGVACDGLSSTGAAFADLDGDGDLDLIVNSVGNGTRVFFNDGRGRFAAAPTVFNSRKGGMSLALADVDGDGFLDLYVVNYRTSALMDMPNARATFKTLDGKQTVATVNGRPVTDPDLVDRFNIGPRGAIEENGEPDVLYRNVSGTNLMVVPFGGGNFLDEDGRPLAKPPLDWGLAAMFRDINGDGLPDLYVCNDFQTPDRFWINQGGGKFRLLPRLAQRKSSLSSMAVDFADINRDGFDDFLVLDMMSREHSQRMRLLSGRNEPSSAPGQFDDRPQCELNTLFLNRGDRTFAEIAQLSGLEAAEWAWSCIFLDVDLDGWEDLLVVNGMERAARDLDVVAYMKKLRATRKLSDAEIFQARRMFPRLATANLAFRNRGDLTFEEIGQAWSFDWIGVSSAMALADLDNDGDLDVVGNNLNAAAGIFRNDTREPRVAVRLKGQAPNTRGIGAKIKVFGGPVPMQSQEMICGGRYLSCDDTLRVFAAGSLTNDLRIEVTWRSGKRSLVSDVKPNYLYEIDESQAVEGAASERQSVGALENLHSSAQNSENHAPTLRRPDAPPLFEDVSALLQHAHHDDLFDDFSRQPLLPNKLSQLGPGVSWFDVDCDGREDLIVGSGKGGLLGVYRNRGTNGFERLLEPVFAGLVTRDQTSILGWRSSTNQTFLLAGCANYEDGLANGPAARQYDFARKVVDDSLTTQESSTGPLALADLDGDGMLDLFVGGRVIPSRYPEAASSRIYRQNGHQWRVDGETTRILEKVGLVSGAVFSDLDGDGFAELILACEWGPIRIFRNDRGKFVPWDLPVVLPGTASNNEQRSTISQLTGWWNGVTAGDFDGDGRLDLAASNWGRNTKYQSHRTQPLTIYYGDFAGDGTVQLVEAHYEAALKKTVPERQLDDLAKGLPFLNETFSSHRAYSVASVAEVLGERLSAAKTWQANWLESTVFLNRGDHFEARVLPVEAQIAPVFGICVGDFDGEGNEDLFLAQNFFATQPETPRYDAGRGLWLRGDGRGGFSAVSGQESGIAVYGEGRGCALCDFDGDGRVDLAIAQNSAATKLYHNQTGRVGLRVRLEGPAGNPQGIGAVLRLKCGERFGPAREIHAGSGYWSQDSAVQVMATPAAPTQIWVRWPGGKTVTADIPAGAREISVGFDGQVKLIR